ncbi:MAG: hypothetical protein R3C59_22220 [Planctomycetaceae bacterium]
MHDLRHRILILGYVLGGWLPLQEVSAEVPLRQRAMDVFILNDGTRLLGLLLNPEDRNVHRVLCEAAWLKSQVPTLFEHARRAVCPTLAESQTVESKLRAHIQTLKQNPPHDLERIGWLTERLTDLLPQPDAEWSPDAVVLEFPVRLVRRTFLLKPDVRRIGAVAILNQVADAHTRSADSLAQELRDLSAGSVLRTDVPHTAAAADSDDQRFLRILMAAESLFGNRCRLIRHSGQYVSADPESIDLTELLPQMLLAEHQNQLSDVLNQLIKPNSAGAVAFPAKDKPTAIVQPLASRATAMAERQNAALVEVTQMHLDAGKPTARVDIEIYFRAPGETVWKKRAQVDGTATSVDITSEQTQHIANDPQVRQITGLFSQLGADSGSLAAAMSVGAVVQAAQAKAQQQLTTYLSASQRPIDSFSLQEAHLAELPDNDGDQ